MIKLVVSKVRWIDAINRDALRAEINLDRAMHTMEVRANHIWIKMVSHLMMGNGITVNLCRTKTEEEIEIA